MAEIVHYSSIFALAGFGALVRYGQKFTGDKASRPDWEWHVATIHVGTGAFAGLLTSWIIERKFDAEYVHFAVAVAGYGGPLTIEAFGDALRNVLNRTASKDPDAKG